MQLPQTIALAVTDWHVVQAPHGSVSKQPQAGAPVHPLGIGMHSGGRLQHPAQRPVTQIWPAPHVLVPHSFPLAPATPPAPTVPADPPVAPPPPPLLEPEAPPVAPPSLDAHAEMKTTATTATDRERVIVMLAPQSRKTPSVAPNPFRGMDSSIPVPAGGWSSLEAQLDRAHGQAPRSLVRIAVRPGTSPETSLSLQSMRRERAQRQRSPATGWESPYGAHSSHTSTAAASRPTVSVRGSVHCEYPAGHVLVAPDVLG
jgi:hypothetical protein